MMLALSVIGAAGLLTILMAVLLVREKRRTRELEAEAEGLRRRAEELEAASHARSRFLAMMSHEIRTPLTGIVGFGEALADEALTPAGRHAVESIRRASRSLQGLLGDILDFSRIDADALPMQKVPTDLDALLHQVRDEFVPQARQRGLAFGLTVSDDARRWTETDPLRLRQIVVNLVSNAIRYTETGMVQIAASTAPGRPDTVVIEVIDTGLGVAPEDRRRIFDVFAQAAEGDVIQNADGGGVGLGLAIADGLVRAMGGTIALDSTLGEGSTFTVTLPLPACPAPPASEEATAAPAAAAQPANVLLVDDVEMNRDLFAGMLARTGHQVVTAPDGDTALRLLERNRFDLAFVDIQMPFMDGIELTRLIRASDDPSVARLPIVALSAAAYGEDRARAEAAGMNDYVTKPATRDDIAAAAKAEPVAAQIAATVPAAVESVPEAASTPPPLDRAEFEVQRETFGDERLLRFLGMLEAELGRRTAAIDDATARDDRAEIGQHAHAIASASGNLGFRYLMGLGHALVAPVGVQFGARRGPRRIAPVDCRRERRDRQGERRTGRRPARRARGGLTGRRGDHAKRSCHPPVRQRSIQRCRIATISFGEYSSRGIGDL